MSDLIDRQAAIDEIKNYCENGCDIAEDNWCPSCQREQFIKLLKALPTVPPEPHWIPVEKELPEPRIDVWVNSDLGQMVGYYDEMVNLWYGRDYLELIVNAWMPLPKPFEGGTE